MQKGIISRLIIDEILISLKNEFISFDYIFEKKIKNKNISLSDKKLIQNVVFCCMRNFLTINKIINLYVKKINYNSNNYFLILSSIAQIIFLNFKDYAVVNSTVEIAKKKDGANSKFINGLLRNIIKNKNKINIQSNFQDLPGWFVEKNKNWNKKQKIDFVKTIKEKPSLHIVFKFSNDIKKLELNGVKTSENSIAINYTGKIENIPGFENGLWWIQDFSVMLPVYLLKDMKNKIVIDMCAAPGGKTFQALNYGALLESYEINNEKANLMKKNLQRLNFKKNIYIKNILKINDKKKYDIVLLDAPCTSVGTIRRNPEIFYRKKIPNFKKIISIQKNLLEKASLIVKKKGVIIYMVCSFLKEEGEDQINIFLKKNKNYKLKHFKTKNKLYNKFINKNGLIYILPQKIDNKFFIDGFFAAIIMKHD